jgi:hypothetical protein
MSGTHAAEDWQNPNEAVSTVLLPFGTLSVIKYTYIGELT